MTQPAEPAEEEPAPLAPAAPAEGDEDGVGASGAAAVEGDGPGPLTDISDVTTNWAGLPIPARPAPLPWWLLEAIEETPPAGLDTFDPPADPPEPAAITHRDGGLLPPVTEAPTVKELKPPHRAPPRREAGRPTARASARLAILVVVSGSGLAVAVGVTVLLLAYAIRRAVGG